MNEQQMKCLRDWRACIGTISQLSESEVDGCIDHEIKNQKRASILIRLHQRKTTLRAARERIEILEQARAL